MRRGGKWGRRGREVGEKGEGSGGEGGGKWGRRGREVGMGYPPVHPLIQGFLHVVTLVDEESPCVGSFKHSWDGLQKQIGQTQTGLLSYSD